MISEQPFLKKSLIGTSCEKTLSKIIQLRSIDDKELLRKAQAQLNVVHTVITSIDDKELLRKAQAGLNVVHTVIISIDDKEGVSRDG